MKQESTLWDKFLIPIITGTVATVVGGIILFRLTMPSSDVTPTRIAQATTTIGLPTNVPVPTTLPTYTTLPTAKPTVAPTNVPTATPLPPTPTRVPTFTPSPSPTSLPSSIKISADGATMVYVPAGKFWMGSSDADKQASDNEKPQHEVDLDAFWIDKYEVTNALYKKCVDSGKCASPKANGSYTRNPYYGDTKYDNYPVVNVTWENGMQYCIFAKKQLPTEAQWEKAARGTDRRSYPWGDTFDVGKLNSSEGGKGDTTAVGSYLGDASPYGAMDMAGNVSEWVVDGFDQYYYKNSPVHNPKNEAIDQNRVVRGGSWFHNSYVRTWTRTAYVYSFWISRIGFRCVE